jgi:two-component system response regulator (stage 0 sporulation protein A)
VLFLRANAILDGAFFVHHLWYFLAARKNRIHERRVIVKQRIVIADTDCVFRDELAATLEARGDFEIVGIADDGEKAIEMVRQQHPDIFILDFLLPQYDGISVLEKILYMQKRPKILAATLFINHFVAKSAVRLGVQQLLRKPCSAERVVAHLQQMLRGEQNVPAIFLWEGEKTAECLVTKMLHQIGVPANIKGYCYVREAILLAAQVEQVDKTVLHRCYEKVAQSFQTTPKRVASAINSAVNIAWDRGDLDTLQNYFGYTVSNIIGMPTNSEFIAILADRLRLFLKNNKEIER